MSFLSREEYLQKGHQIDLDMMNLDSAIRGVASEGGVPASDLATWGALYSKWKGYFEKNIKNIPIVPWPSDNELNEWIDRFEEWSAKNKHWALLSGSARARTIAAAMPKSPANLQYEEEKRKAIEAAEEKKKASGMPVWGWLLMGTAFLGAVGYSLGSVARIAK